ncbi:ribosome-associated translation inhibitor RaiA [Sphingomonas lacunae]|uniref:Ribosome hibernation promoting factor n=1 Tax=Sphingomonas lacunae TaxID=2698828 RepID=A0A6M4AY14_9SPHN|nr:ribosome-associated translation inhibitor RaiA [Sphingomonas lacunae]QJQ31871.1 ribosome-associated translation inhibitor RaiA [Sphingomonas lacunae]
MEIRVSGHQIETGEALQTHVADRMNAIADKYFSRAISAHATFGRGPHDSITCDIISHVMQGVVLKGHGQAQDAHVSFESAAEKIEKQLRRYMRRLKDKGAANAAGNGADAPTLDDLDLDAGYTVFEATEAEEEGGDAPAIIAETRVDIPTASVSDAVMMLDLRNTTALLFVNARTGAHNMVYRRPDNMIGWVEPKRN